MSLMGRLSWAFAWPGAAVWIAVAALAYTLAAVVPFGIHASAPCGRPPGAAGPWEVVFGRFSSEPAAAALATRAQAVGFKGLTTEMDGCGRWQVALHRIPSQKVGREIQAEARSARLTVSVERLG